MKQFPIPVPTVETAAEILTPEIVVDPGYAYYNDGNLQIYGPPALVELSLVNHFEQLRREHYAAFLLPLNRMFIFIMTAFTMDQFDWTEKVIEGATKVYSYVFG